MGSGNYIIGNHVFVKNGIEAISLYKEAFDLEDKGDFWLDDEGFLVHRELFRDGKLFFSVSDEKALPDGFRYAYSNNVRPTMMFMVCFKKDSDLQKACALLRNDEYPCTEMMNPDGKTVDVIDKYGVYWWLYVPKDKKAWRASFVPK